MGICACCGEECNTPVCYMGDYAEEHFELWFCSDDCLSSHLAELKRELSGAVGFFPRMKKLVLNNVRYNLLLMPILFAIYVPYNVLFIGYSSAQLLKWMTTAGILSAFANLVLQPYQSYCYRRKWLR